MDIQKKSKETLISELTELQLAYNSMKTRLEKELAAKREEESIFRKLILTASEFIEFTDDSPDFSKLLQTIIDISGAKYAALNIFDENGLDFTTVAFEGIKESLKHVFSSLGYEVINKHWDHDPIRAEKTKQHIITRFLHLSELSVNAIPNVIISLIEKTFDVEESFIVKIVKENKVLGDFTLIFSKGKTIRNESLVELYANMAGLFLDRVKLTNLLKWSEIKHSKMISNISDVIGIISPEGIIKYKSPNCEKWFGWQPQDLVGTEGWSTIHPNDLGRIQTEFSTVLDEDNNTKTMEFRYQCKDGSYKMVELSAINLTKDPNIDGILLNYHDITAYKKVEEMLANETQRLSYILEGTDAGTWEWNILTGEKIYNERWAEMLGYTLKEISPVTTETVNKFVHPEDLIVSDELLAKHIRGELAYYECELRMKHKNGNWVWILDRGKVHIRDKDGRPLFISGTHQNITDRKETEQAFIDSEKNFHSIFDSSSGAIAIIDPDTTISMVNEEFCRRSGYSKEEITGMSWTQLLPYNELYRFNDFQDRRRLNPDDGPDRYDFSFLNKYGEPKQVIGSFAILSNQQMIASLVDITDRKIAEEKLKESLSLMKAILESINNGILVVSNQGAVLRTNEMFSKMWKVPANVVSSGDDNTLLNYVLEQLTDPEEFLNKVLELYKTPDAESDSLVHFKDGRVFDRISKPIYLVGEVRGRVWSFFDITERKRAEKEIIDALDKAEESNRLKSTFLTNMSHEIRTPMNGILGFTELLSNPDLSSDDRQNFIEIIRISGARMLNTINNIIDISIIESGVLKVDKIETNINKQIEFIFQFFRQEVLNKGLSLEFRTGLPLEKAIIITDNEKVIGILTNLLKNAIKFTKSGSIEFGYECKGETLEFFIKDTGVGISPAQQQIIFERFRQGNESYNRDYEGSGLGLTISKSYVEIMGGQIWLESEVGKGTTFYFTIPFEPLAEEKYSAENNLTEIDNDMLRKKLKILIVDDDRVSRLLIAKMVGVISKEILYAGNGAEAIKFSSENSDLDLIFMDLSLPEIDGYEATKRIRKFDSKIIIIAQTAYGFSEDRDKAIEAGCNEYISKPINKRLLHKLIFKYFSN